MLIRDYHSRLLEKENEISTLKVFNKLYQETLVKSLVEVEDKSRREKK